MAPRKRSPEKPNRDTTPQEIERPRGPEVRLSNEERALLTRAGRLLGQDVTTFMRSTALLHARRLLAEFDHGARTAETRPDDGQPPQPQKPQRS